MERFPKMDKEKPSENKNSIILIDKMTVQWQHRFSSKTIAPLSAKEGRSLLTIKDYNRPEGLGS